MPLPLIGTFRIHYLDAVSISIRIFLCEQAPARHVESNKYSRPDTRIPQHCGTRPGRPSLADNVSTHAALLRKVLLVCLRPPRAEVRVPNVHTPFLRGDDASR